MMKFGVLCMLLYGSLAVSTTVLGSEYDLPLTGNQLVGQSRQVVSRYEDDFVRMADRFDVGFLALSAANPDLNPTLPGEGTSIELPVFHVLPDTPRRGIVINLAEFRLYYFPEDEDAASGGTSKVFTFPIGIGKSGWDTPVAETRVTRIVHNPTWTPPQSIVKEYKKAGASLPTVVPAGPENPLGQIALRLALPGYLLHGTNNEAGVGMRVSHGCLRLRNRDIATLAALVKVNTPVSIVNQSLKAGWHDGHLYLEGHRPLDDVHRDAETENDDIQRNLEAVLARVQQADGEALDMQSLISQVLKNDNVFSGLPMRLQTLAPRVESANSE